MGLFTLDVDGRIVQFVRPADIEDPAWGAYDGDRFLGMVYAEPDRDGPLWQASLTSGRHHQAGTGLDRSMRLYATAGTFTVNCLTLHHFLLILAVVANLGETVGGKYRLNEVLGQGGMGRVWRAWDEQLHRDVAIKEILLSAGHPHHEQLRARFLREARAAARLSHPGIVSVYEIIEHAGSPMIAMQYVQGRSLAALLKAKGPLPPKRVAEIGAQVADALSAAHKARIVHRDIKPDNILISADNGQALVADFGIALLQDGTVITDSGAIPGTVPFLSPEQAQWLGATDKSDVWALGVTLYAAVEGIRPFSAPESRELISKIVHQPFRPMEKAGELTGVLTRMLSKAPDVRPDSKTVASLLRSAPPTITDEQRQEMEKQLRREVEEAARLRKLAQTVTPQEMLEKLRQEDRGAWTVNTVTLPDLNERRPDLIEPGAQVTITRWLKDVGDTAAEGDLVLELSVHGVDAPVSMAYSGFTGILHAFHAAEGQSTKTDSPVFTVIKPYIAPEPPAAPAPAPAEATPHRLPPTRTVSVQQTRTPLAQPAPPQRNPRPAVGGSFSSLGVWLGWWLGAVLLYLFAMSQPIAYWAHGEILGFNTFPWKPASQMTGAHLTFSALTIAVAVTIIVPACWPLTWALDTLGTGLMFALLALDAIAHLVILLCSLLPITDGVVLETGQQPVRFTPLLGMVLLWATVALADYTYTRRRL